MPSSKFTCETLSGKSSPIGVSDRGEGAVYLGEDVQIFFDCTNKTDSLRCLTYYEGLTFAKKVCF